MEDISDDSTMQGDKKTDVEKYVAEHYETTELLETGKLRFTLTGMEFPRTADMTLLQAYAEGRSMRRAQQASKNLEYDFTQHLPFIIPHREYNPKYFLYCVLTFKTVRRTPEAVRRHVAGKRFARLFAAKQKKREAYIKRRDKALKWREFEKKGKGKGKGKKEGEGKKDANGKDGQVAVTDANGDDADIEEAAADIQEADADGEGDVLDGIEMTDDENEDEDDGEDDDGEVDDMSVEDGETEPKADTANGHSPSDIAADATDAGATKGSLAKHVDKKPQKPASSSDDDDDKPAKVRKGNKGKSVTGKRKRTDKAPKKTMHQRRRRKKLPSGKAAA